MKFRVWKSTRGAAQLKLAGILFGTFISAQSAFAQVPQYTVVTPIHSFYNPYDPTLPNPRANAEGGHPWANLIEGPDGLLYGTTWKNGPYDGGTTRSCASNSNTGSDVENFECPGTVFRISPQGAGFTVIHAFTPLGDSSQVPRILKNTDGYQPVAPMTVGPDGFIYGTTSQGGSGPNSAVGSCGVVFRFDPSNLSTFRTVHNFCKLLRSADGNGPFGQLVTTSTSDMYGVTKSGTNNGSGVVYKFSTSTSGCENTDSCVTPIYSFDRLPRTRTNYSGSLPFGSPALTSSGSLLGMTFYGGTSGRGTLYSVDPAAASPSATQLYSFPDYQIGTLNDDNNSTQSVILGSDGKYYGTRQFGGLNGTGFVFRYDPSAVSPVPSFVILHHFSAISNTSVPRNSNIDGAQPIGTLIEGHDGFLYGTTVYGGTNGTGAIFQIRPDNTDITAGRRTLTLYSFSTVDPTGMNYEGARPRAGLMQIGSGGFFGVAFAGGRDPTGANRSGFGFGTVFRMKAPLSFDSITNANPSVVYTSEAIKVTALWSSSISISGGEYSINGGAFTSASGTIQTDDVLRVRVTASSSANTRVLATLTFPTIGHSSFAVTTHP